MTFVRCLEFERFEAKIHRIPPAIILFCGSRSNIQREGIQLQLVPAM